MQREMPFLGATKTPELAPQFVVDATRDMLHAVQITVDRSGYSRDTVCDALAIDKGHFSRMMTGRASMPLNKLPDLMAFCGSLLCAQVLAREMGLLVSQDAKKARRAELVRALAELESAA